MISAVAQNTIAKRSSDCGEGVLFRYLLDDISTTHP